MRGAKYAWALVTAVSMIAGTAQAQQKPKPPKPVMSASSQVAGSLYVTYVAAWIDIVAKAFTGLTILQEPGGSFQNIILVSTGRTDFGITSSSQAYLGYYGLGWARGTKYQDFVALHPAYPTYMAIVALADSKVKSLQDLQGRQLGIGVPGGGSDVVARQLMAYLNIRPSRYVNASWEDTGGLMRDGLVDALLYIAGHPAGFLQEQEIGRELRFLRLSAAQIEGFLKAHPYYTPVTLKAGTYKSLKEPLSTVGQMNYMMGRRDLPDDFVVHLLDAVYNNAGKLAAVHPDFKNTSWENVAGIPVPFHPAARRYYETRKVTLKMAPPPKS